MSKVELESQLVQWGFDFKTRTVAMLLAGKLKV